jgi:hypothetical protein
MSPSERIKNTCYHWMSCCQSLLNFSTASSVSGSVTISINTGGVTVRSCAPASKAVAASAGVYFYDWRGVPGSPAGSQVCRNKLSSGTHGILSTRCAARMQQVERMVNERRRPFGRRGDIWLTRSQRMARSRLKGRSSNGRSSTCTIAESRAMVPGS